MLDWDSNTIFNDLHIDKGTNDIFKACLVMFLGLRNSVSAKILSCRAGDMMKLVKTISQILYLAELGQH
jgi:hypothetical protein